jgi:hypothetical protein
MAGRLDPRHDRVRLTTHERRAITEIERGFWREAKEPDRHDGGSPRHRRHRLLWPIRSEDAGGRSVPATDPVAPRLLTPSLISLAVVAAAAGAALASASAPHAGAVVVLLAAAGSVAVVGYRRRRRSAAGGRRCRWPRRGRY